MINFFKAFFGMFESALMKMIAVIIVLLAACFILGYSLAHCATLPKAMENMPADTLCKATLDGPAIRKCQEILINTGHGELTVMRGDVFATPASYKKGIYVAVVNCQGQDGKVYVGKIYFKGNAPHHIIIEATDKRSL
jgi:hypothetical protein